MACGASGQMLCKRDPITGSELCQRATGNYAEAAVNTGVAAGVFGITGCTVNGCPLPTQCNPNTKRCESIRCSESKPCPAGYFCSTDSMLCR
jgi:hypothetical protein